MPLFFFKCFLYFRCLYFLQGPRNSLANPFIFVCERFSTYGFAIASPKKISCEVNFYPIEAFWMPFKIALRRSRAVSGGEGACG
jgi:hypothetical protein